MNLTEHFTLHELISSEYAVRHGLDNTPTPEIIANLEILARGLERIRDLTGGPIIVTSGYRSPKVNSGIGGSKTSDHVKGLAADIRHANMEPRVLAKVIESTKDALQFKQCILEFGSWVHVSFPDVDETPKLEVLTAMKSHGVTVYARGVV